MKKKLSALVRIFVGSLVFAASLALFLGPFSLVAGGISGLAILINHFLPIGVGLLFFLLNLPLILAGLFKFGKGFTAKTLFATFLSSFFTALLERFSLVFLQYSPGILFASLFGGILCGVGLGIVYRADATTGGTDIGVRLLSLVFSRLTPGTLFFLLDSAVILACAFLYQSLSLTLYSVLSLALSGIAFDLTLAFGKAKRKKAPTP